MLRLRIIAFDINSHAHRLPSRQLLRNTKSNAALHPNDRDISVARGNVSHFPLRDVGLHSREANRPLRTDNSRNPQYSAADSIADIASSHGFSGGISLRMSGGDNIPDTQNRPHGGRRRYMHSLTVQRRKPLRPTHASQLSCPQQTVMMSEDGVFHMPRTGSETYGVSLGVETYGVDVLGATYTKEGKTCRVQGFTAPYWKEVTVRVQGAISGGYTGLRRDVDADEGRAEAIDGSILKQSIPEIWYTMYTVDKDSRLRDMVNELLLDEGE